MRLRIDSRTTLIVLLSLLLIVPLFMAPSCSRSADLEMTQIFQEAQERFNHATTTAGFLEAAGLYERILDKGLACGALYYNLGNAYMQADERGRAIAAYRQAKRFRPRDPFLDANLKYALGAEAKTVQKARLIDHIFFWKDWLSYPEKAHLTLLLAGATLLLALCGLVWNRRKLWRRLSAGALILTLVAFASTGYDYYRFELVKHGVIIKDHVTARKGNSDTYEPSFSEDLMEGTEFRVKDSEFKFKKSRTEGDTRQEWVLIQLEEGPAQEGWIRRSDAVFY